MCTGYHRASVPLLSKPTYPNITFLEFLGKNLYLKYTQYGPITNGVVRAHGGADRPAADGYRTILRVNI